MIKRNTSSLTVFSENRKNKISIPLLGNITSRTERSIEKRSIRRLKSLHTMLHATLISNAYQDSDNIEVEFRELHSEGLIGFYSEELV
jgi:hypothetical protein